MPSSHGPLLVLILNLPFFLFKLDDGKAFAQADNIKGRSLRVEIDRFETNTPALRQIELSLMIAQDSASLLLPQMGFVRLSMLAPITGCHSREAHQQKDVKQSELQGQSAARRSMLSTAAYEQVCLLGASGTPSCRLFRQQLHRVAMV